MAGPVWISTREIIEEVWGVGSVILPTDGQKEIKPTSETIITSLKEWDKGILNLGWLLFTCKKDLQINPPLVAAKAGSSGEVQQPPEWTAITNRIVLVDTKLFSQIVNSNLEVRTSVSIRPETGAAESGALFTYEAIPRATWLYCDVIEDDYRKKNAANYPFPVTQQYNSENGKDRDGKAFPQGVQWDRPIDVVKAGMKLIEYLGVGGMGTRGFGRMHLIDWESGNGGVK